MLSNSAIVPVPKAGQAVFSWFSVTPVCPPWNASAGEANDNAIAADAPSRYRTLDVPVMTISRCASTGHCLGDQSCTPA